MTDRCIRCFPPVAWLVFHTTRRRHSIRACRIIPFRAIVNSGEEDSCGVSPPHGEVPSLCSGQALLFRQKDPKPWAPGRGPSGAFAPVPFVWAAELASLKQSSPSYWIRDCGAAAPAGALRWRHLMARGMNAKDKEEGKNKAPGAGATEEGKIATEGRIRCGHYGGGGLGGMRCRHYRGGGGLLV